jgi:hypothetical protein
VLHFEIINLSGTRIRTLVQLTSAAAVLLLMFASRLSGSADDLERVWTLKVTEDMLGVKNLKGTQPPPVWGIGFSPDEQHLAVGIGQFDEGVSDRTFVLILSVAGPAVERKFEIIGRYVWIFSAEEPRTIKWSPDGEWVVVPLRPHSIFLNVKDGSSRIFHEEGWRFLGFTNGSEAILQSSRAWEPVVVRVVGWDGRLIQTWTPYESLRLLDIAPRQGWVAAARTGNDIPSSGETQLLDVISGIVLRRWPLQSHGAFFADDGRALCSVLSGVVATVQLLRCWPTGAEGEVADHRLPAGRSYGVGTFEMQAGGTTIVGSDHEVMTHRGKSWHALDLEGTSLFFRGYFLWDFRGNRELAYWKPERQTVRTLRFPQRRFDRVKEAIHFRLALSPKGTYLAEAGAGEVRLRRVR